MEKREDKKLKRALYTMPAVMVIIFYGMLALLAGGFASFQVRAWLMILMPTAAAVLLLAGKWWGGIFGMLLGGLMISVGMAGSNDIVMLFGVIVFLYYMVMGILCLKDAKKQSE